LLQLRPGFHPGATAGLRLVNAGLGPALLTNTVLTFDGKTLGAFNETNVDKVRDTLAMRPSATTFGHQEFLATDYDRHLLSIGPYDPDQHAEFVDLLRKRIHVEIHYESLYGGEKFTAAWPNRDTAQSAVCRPVIDMRWTVSEGR
jgi:hypothetical protein